MCFSNARARCLLEIMACISNAGCSVGAGGGNEAKLWMGKQASDEEGTDQKASRRALALVVLLKELP